MREFNLQIILLKEMEKFKPMKIKPNIQNFSVFKVQFCDTEKLKFIKFVSTVFYLKQRS